MIKISAIFCINEVLEFLHRMQEQKIASLGIFEIWPKRQETCGNCNSLQDKELAKKIGSFTVKRKKMQSKTKRHAETVVFCFVIPYIIRNYETDFAKGSNL